MTVNYKRIIARFTIVFVLAFLSIFLCSCPAMSYNNSPHYQTNTQWISDDHMLFVCIGENNSTYGYIEILGKKYPVEFNFTPSKVCIHDMNYTENTFSCELAEFVVEEYEHNSLTMKSKDEKSYKIFNNGTIHLTKVVDEDMVDFDAERIKTEFPYINGRTIFSEVFSKDIVDELNEQYDYNNDSARVSLELTLIGCERIERIQVVSHDLNVVIFNVIDSNGELYNVEYNFNERYVKKCINVK